MIVYAGRSPFGLDNNLLTTAILVGGTVYTTTYDYNSLDQLLSVTDPGARTTTTQEDPNGNVVATIDGAGDATANSYNAAGELVLSVDPMGNPTQYQYDATANLIAETDPDGNTTHWGFNADNQVIQQISPTGGVTTTTYDNASNVATVVDPDGREKEYSYNADNQVTEVDWYNSASPSHVLEDELVYTYYNNGSLKTAGNEGGTYTFTYDDYGNVATVQDGYNGLTLYYTYDNNHNVTSISDSQGDYLSSTFNGVNEQTTEELYPNVGSGLSVSMSYDAAGQMTEIERYNDYSLASVVSDSTFTYDKAGNMTGETDSFTSGTITYVNAYDTADRITSEGLETATGGSPTYTTTTYEYDRTSEVTGVAVNGAPTATFSYDANGNRDMSGYSATGAGDNNQISTDGTWTYTYDAAGNVTEMSKGTATYTWDFTYNQNDQMISAEEHATASTTSTLLTEIAYGYDVFGDMISRTQTVSGTMTTDFAYDVSNGSIVHPLYAELNGSGDITEYYLYANGTIAARTGGDTDGTAWLVTDYEGSVRDVLNASGTLEDVITYGAFGVSQTRLLPPGRGTIHRPQRSHFKGWCLTARPDSTKRCTASSFQMASGRRRIKPGLCRMSTTGGKWGMMR